MAPPLHRHHRDIGHPPFDRLALVLQGGGALGSYQAGVYEALAEADLQPDWIAGISIGALNSAIIAGNPPEQRVARLRAFWETITTDFGLDRVGEHVGPWLDGHLQRRALARLSSLSSLLRGQPGFFEPRLPPPFLMAPGSSAATSYYDTRALKATLEALVDFDRLNDSREMRFSVGAVNVRTGNMIYFDNTTHEIRPEHVMASGSLPPGFPAVEIEGEYYWDGGLVSNTPLNWILDEDTRDNIIAFQVDLWSALGIIPSNLDEVQTRQKDIQYSSRTRATTSYFKRSHERRRLVAQLLERLPPELRQTPEAEALAPFASDRVFTIVQLIYQSKEYEGYSKDYEFSRGTMAEHWKAGYHDTARSLRHPEALERPDADESVRTFDVHRDGRE